jgi:hypothetical protein
VSKKIPSWASSARNIESIFKFFQEANSQNLIKTKKVPTADLVNKALAHLDFLEQKYEHKKPKVKTPVTITTMQP